MGALQLPCGYYSTVSDGMWALGWNCQQGPIVQMWSKEKAIQVSLLLTVSHASIFQDCTAEHGRKIAFLINSLKYWLGNEERKDILFLSVQQLSVQLEGMYCLILNSCVGKGMPQFWKRYWVFLYHQFQQRVARLFPQAIWRKPSYQECKSPHNLLRQHIHSIFSPFKIVSKMNTGLI